MSKGDDYDKLWALTDQVPQLRADHEEGRTMLMNLRAAHVELSESHKALRADHGILLHRVEEIERWKDSRPPDFRPLLARIEELERRQEGLVAMPRPGVERNYHLALDKIEQLQTAYETVLREIGQLRQQLSVERARVAEARAALKVAETCGCVVIGRCARCDEAVCWAHHRNVEADMSVSKEALPLSDVFARRCTRDLGEKR